jgi:hypothetical protein
MKYVELVKGVRNFEDSFWFVEYLYFKALELLGDVRADLGRLETVRHVEEIIKMFLIHWGGMRRTVGREGLDWEQLTRRLREAKDAFRKLYGKSLLDIDFDDVEVRDAIMRAYEAVNIKYIGATATSKILHLLNPEVYVMWDERIRRKYGVRGDAQGYIDFLKQMKREVEEALEERAREKGCSIKEVAEEICRELPSKKLGKEYSKKTLARIIDEYNWWSTHHEL